MTVRIIEGDALAALRCIETESVQCVVTSPPYWALRAYGTPPVVWGGNPQHGHEWSDARVRHAVGNSSNVRGKDEDERRIGRHDKAEHDGNQRLVPAGSFCPCGAWRGELGQEPTPELFIEHMVSVFREVKRVLKQDGTLWLNIGDSYSGSGKGPSNSLQRPASCLNDGQLRNGAAPTNWIPVPEGTKPKDLVGIPWMLAFALRADGWYLRSNIRWCKRAPMPESVKDRPTSAVEDIFLLAKSERYFYNEDGAKEPAVSTHPSGNGYSRPDQISRGGRGQAAGWQLGPEPFPGAHFATFPPEIPRRCIAAGTRRGDTVLDPFGGAGTVGLEADRMGRDAVLIEINPEYAELARNRIANDAPMLGTPVEVQAAGQQQASLWEAVS
jgi:DNA modification methylase